METQRRHLLELELIDIFIVNIETRTKEETSGDVIVVEGIRPANRDSGNEVTLADQSERCGLRELSVVWGGARKLTERGSERVRYDAEGSASLHTDGYREA